MYSYYVRGAPPSNKLNATNIYRVIQAVSVAPVYQTKKESLILHKNTQKTHSLRTGCAQRNETYP